MVSHIFFQETFRGSYGLCLGGARGMDRFVKKVLGGARGLYMAQGERGVYIYGNL